MKLEIPVNGSDKEFVTRFENHMILKGIKYKRKGRLPDYTYDVWIDDPMIIFWLGCNYVSISHKLYDGPLTISG